MPEKTKKNNILHKKIHLLAVFLIVGAVAGSLTWITSVKAFFFTVGPQIGVKVLSIPLKCIPDPCPGPTCGMCSNCLVCGNLVGVCSSLYEIKAQYLSGNNILHYGTLGPVGAFCTVQPLPPNGGIFSPNGFCLGNVAGIGPHILNNFGCSSLF